MSKLSRATVLTASFACLVFLIASEMTSLQVQKKHIYSSRDEECSFKICRLKISRVSYLFNMIKSLQGTCFSSGRDLNFSTTNCNIVVVDFEFSGAADTVSIRCAQPGERNKEIPQAAADLLWQFEQSTPVSGLNKQHLKSADKVQMSQMLLG